MSRFSDIRKAPRLQQAFTRYQQWQDQQATRQPNVGGGTARGSAKFVAVLPFGFDPGAGSEKAVVKVSRRANQLLNGDLGTRVAAPGNGDLRIPGFIPARIVLFQGTGSSTEKTSEITGIRYLKRGGQSYTHPFGRGTATDKEIEALNAIATTLTDTEPNRTISYKPEGRRAV